MLRTLTIRDFILVKRQTLSFESGLTVLTGETGAGKSMLLDALGLLLGDRADASVVRAGCDRAELEALFELDDAPAATAWLVEAGLDDEDLCVLRRVIDASGKSRAFINGRSATLTQLRELGEHLVDIHGQHAHQSLVKPDTQRWLLDVYGGLLPLARQVREAWRLWQQEARLLGEASGNAERLQADRERLQWMVDELAPLQLTPARWTELQQEHRRAAHAASILHAVERVAERLDEGQINALSLLNDARHALQEAAGYDAQLQEPLLLLDEAEIRLAEVVSVMRQHTQRVEVDPAYLAELERELDQIMGLARKYRVEPDGLPALLDETRAGLARLEAAADLDALRARAQASEAAFRALAGQLSEQRQVVAQRLGTAVTASIRELAMPEGTFGVSLNPLPEGAAAGLETVELVIAPYAGAEARPLAKVASGGELSRISLALQVIISQGTAVPTLVFDEVDVGIGGRVAEMVGRLLRDLGGRAQVLCITHLPQVAAWGQHHWQVEKHRADDGTESRIAVLDKPARVEELARMLGGSELTDTTRRHAEEMLRLGHSGAADDARSGS